MTFQKRAIYLAATAALGVAGSAQAHTPWSTTQTEVRISGSSSSSFMLMQTVINHVCDSNIDVFVDQPKTAPQAIDPDTKILTHTTYWAVACTAKASLGVTAHGGRVLVTKSDDGGSGNGTTPVVNGTALKFMTLTAASNCTLKNTHARLSDGSSYTWHDCDGTTVNRAPHAGISDIEPTKFVDSLAPASGNYVRPATNWVEKPLPGLLFGVAV
ncbi:MAG: hypothetical protein FD130_1302, partial [Halothiobacillaceae bacterium]